MSHVFTPSVHDPDRDACTICGRERDAQTHRQALADARKGEEIPRLLSMHTSSAAGRQLLGDLSRSRVALANPGFKQAIDDAIAYMDAHVRFTYTDRKGRTDDHHRTDGPDD